MTAADNSPIITRLKKMLASAKQEDVHEAAVAAAMAQRLMTRYAITESMLREDEPDNRPETFERRACYETGGPLPTWILSLAGNISTVNRCYQTHRASRHGSAIFIHGPVEALDLSVRVFNSLKRTGITTVGDVIDLLEKGDQAVMSIRNFGEKSLDELRQKMREKGYLKDEKTTVE